MSDGKCKQLNDYLRLNGIESNLPDDMPMTDMINMALAKLGTTEEQENE